MNIFVLADTPRAAAQAHLDKHVVKMCSEYTQLLSTAHRLLDGVSTQVSYIDENTDDGKRRVRVAHPLSGEVPFISDKIVLLDDGTSRIKYSLEYQNRRCWNSTHATHPCAVWARETDANYLWLYELFKETCSEYTYRYGKIHKAWRDCGEFLSHAPARIKSGDLTPFAQAMNEEYRNENAVLAYQAYYVGPKARMAKWTRREPPTFFKEQVNGYTDAAYARTPALG